MYFFVSFNRKQSAESKETIDHEHFTIYLDKRSERVYAWRRLLHQFFFLSNLYILENKTSSYFFISQTSFPRERGKKYLRKLFQDEKNGEMFSKNTCSKHTWTTICYFVILVPHFSVAFYPFFFSSRCLRHFIRESKHLIYALSLTVRLLKPLAKMTSKSISCVLIFLFCVARAIAIPRDITSSEYSMRDFTLFSVWLVSLFFHFSISRCFCFSRVGGNRPRSQCRSTIYSFTLKIGWMKNEWIDKWWQNVWCMSERVRGRW